MNLQVKPEQKAPHGPKGPEVGADVVWVGGYSSLIRIPNIIGNQGPGYTVVRGGGGTFPNQDT